MNDKETLEEAAENYSRKSSASVFQENHKKDFKEGAKWQQEQHKIDTDDAYLEGFENGKHWQQERMYSEEELQQKIDAHLEVAKDLWLSAIKEQKRMYSEEEVVNILIKAYEDIGKRKIPNQVVLASWFKQFKKK